MDYWQGYGKSFKVNLGELWDFNSLILFTL